MSNPPKIFRVSWNEWQTWSIDIEADDSDDAKQKAERLWDEQADPTIFNSGDGSIFDDVDAQEVQP